MDDLNLSMTEYTLEINFDSEKGVLEMSGSSYPENSMEFFMPIFNWLEEYIKKINKAITLNLKFEYLNTSSTKCMIDILELLEKYYNTGGEVQVNWYYDEDDEDILETGKDMAEDIVVPISFISC